MPAILGRKICRQFRVEKKNAFFSGGDKIAGKPAIAGELTGLCADSEKDLRRTQ